MLYSLSNLIKNKKLTYIDNIVYLIYYSEVSIEVTDKYGFTPLMQASNKGYTEYVYVLIIIYYVLLNRQII